MVGTHVGLECEVRCSRYIALWGGDGKALRDSLARISKTARGIIDDLHAAESAAWNSDLQASAEFRRQLVAVLTERALSDAWARSRGESP